MALAELNMTTGLVVTEEVETDLYLAARNLPRVSVVDVSGVNPVDLVASEKVVMTVGALKKVEEMLT